VLDQLTALEAELVSYEQIKTDLAAARGRYRELSNAFVDELRRRCAALGAKKKQALVLGLFVLDVQASHDEAVNELRQRVVKIVENTWNKYRLPLTGLSAERDRLHERLRSKLQSLSYV
jgi:hypothetical protein